MSVVYDAGALLAADRDDRQFWAEHRARLEFGQLPTTTAPVVAQVSRSPRQAQLRRLLRGCIIESFQPDQAHAVGELLSATRTRDVVDAHLAVVAAANHAVALLTSDSEDLSQLLAELDEAVEIRLI